MCLSARRAGRLSCVIAPQLRLAADAAADDAAAANAPDMRFYLHSEEEPSFALPVQWDDADTRPVEALLQHFLAAYAAKGGKRSAAQIALSGSDGRLLAPKARVLAVVEDGGDVFAVARPSGAAASASASASAKAPARSAAPAADSEAEALQKVLAPYLDAAQKAWDTRGYRQAKEIYGELVTVHPKLPIALRRLGEIELLCERADPAVGWLLKASRAAPKDAEVRGLLGEAYALQGEHEEAQDAFEIALELTKKKGKKKARGAG